MKRKILLISFLCVFSTMIAQNESTSSFPLKEKHGEIVEPGIFPNPTEDVFKISNDAQVKKVAIYNIVGKEIKSMEHYPGAEHNISSLKKGVYLLRMLNDRGKAVKVMRLNKR